MIYQYDTKRLTYINITKKMILIFIGVFLLMYGSFALKAYIHGNNIEYITQETKAIIIRENDKMNEFSPENLKAYILSLNIKFPHIVYAQAVHETGNFKSKIFKENNNLFGLKLATRRPSTSLGVDNNHAYYSLWKQSVVDYAFLQSSFIYKIRTENEYYQYLSEYYAEDPSYVIKVKRIANQVVMKNR